MADPNKLPIARLPDPPSGYPVRIEALIGETVVWSHVQTGPGAMYVPPLARQFGAPVAIRCIFADGTTTFIPAPDRQSAEVSDG
jgi:hypothetical protein